MRSVDLEVHIAEDGTPRGATAEARIDMPPARLWDVVSDIDRFPERVPMIHRVKRDGSRAHVDLKFKLSLFSVGFHFVVDVVKEENKWVELRYVSGEPRGIVLRFDLEELEGGAACRLRSKGEFDVMSLGWLAKYFLRHHPEIQFGVVPGVAVGLLESMRKAAGG